MCIRARTFIILLLLVIAAGVIWSVFKSKSSGKIRNVVLISIDTCRADHLSCYGYSRKTTPNIDGVAREGILFENVVSPVPLTLPAHSSMFTGTIPPYHGVHDNLQYRLGESNVTLAEILKENGFITCAVIGAFVLDSRFGLEQGFDYYDDYVDDKELGNNVISERTAEKVSRSACNWLSENKDERFFLFLHFFDPHFPYEPSEPFASQFWDNHYAGEIAYTDYYIGRVIDKLKTLGMYDSTLLIITGDHGESRGEHGEKSHGYFIYESTVKVPLIFRLPEGTKPQRMGNVVGLIDIVPTILNILGIEVPKEVQGKDLSGCFGRWRSLEEQRFVYCGSLLPTRYQCNSLLGVISDGWKYIQTTRPELYDLKNDIREMNNLIDKQPHRARLMQDKLKEILEMQVRTAGDSKELHLDQESMSRLESLGYVSSGGFDESFDFDQTKEDPKDYITFHTEQYSVAALVLREKFKEARRLGDWLISKYRNLAYSHFVSGKIAFAEDKFDDAITSFSMALEFQPDLRDAHFKLGQAYARVGKIDNALVHWKEALRLWGTDVSLHADVANVLASLDRLDEAIEHWNKSLELEPDQPDIHNELAIRYYQQQRIADAVRHWNEALKLNPDWADVLNNLAWIYTTQKDSQFHKPPEAVKLAEKACGLTDFEQPKFLDTLSVAYASVGKFDEAVETAKKALDLARSANRLKLTKEIENHLKQYQSSRL